MKKLFLLGFVAMLGLGVSHAASIIWVSDIPDANGADKGFIDLLKGDGHSVTKADYGNTLDAAQLAAVNAANLVIVGRANGSGQFQQAASLQQWNTQVTTPVIYSSAYLVRNNRLRLVAGDNVPDSTGGKLIANVANHPIFSTGVNFANGLSVDNFNLQIDRGTSVNADAPVGGRTLLSIVLPNNQTGIIAAEWAKGAVIGGGQVLSGYRMLFNAGSREADGAAVTTAGVLDLTSTGQNVFLNAVDHALLGQVIPEPTQASLAILALALFASRRRRS